MWSDLGLDYLNKTFNKKGRMRFVYNYFKFEDIAMNVTRITFSRRASS